MSGNIFSVQGNSFNYQGTSFSRQGNNLNCQGTSFSWQGQGQLYLSGWKFHFIGHSWLSHGTDLAKMNQSSGFLDILEHYVHNIKIHTYIKCNYIIVFQNIPPRVSSRGWQQVDREQVAQVDCPNVELSLHNNKTTILDSSMMR